MNPEVTVVVPAFNASATLRETLASVSAQTVRDIEILVVDDGSTDDTARIARSVAADDSRIRLLSQANSGVAAARNAGLKAARANLVAPIDADDLWHPTNLHKQLEVFRRDSELALVYSNFRLINMLGAVIQTPPQSTVRGWVYLRHLAHNIVGNGSAIMFRRDLALGFGGYDPRLRQAGAEGCEDYLLQIQLARRSRFGVVAEPLVGYRKRRDAMSADTARMLLSRIVALTLLEAEGAPAPDIIRDTKAGVRVALAILHARRGALIRSLREVGQAALDTPPASWPRVVDHGVSRATRNLRNRLARLPPDPSLQRQFLDAAPEAAIHVEQPAYVRRILGRLAPLEHAYAFNSAKP
jgi:hypothetical protein